MNSQEYRKLARWTMNFSLTKKEQLAMLGLGLVGEAGDLMWYLENLLDYIGISMDEVYKKNIEKLSKRYPNGFSEKDSRERSE